MPMASDDSYFLWRKRYERVDGRWLVERDRHGLLPEDQPPGRHTESAREVLDRALDGAREAAALPPADLERGWPEAVGPQIAAHARLVQCRNGRLTVEVDHSIWMAELMRLRPQLLAKLQATFGPRRVSDLHFTVLGQPR